MLKVVFTIQRIDKECRVVVCEDMEGRPCQLDLKLFAENVKENDCVRFVSGKYIVDTELTKKLQQETAELYNKIFGGELVK